MATDVSLIPQNRVENLITDLASKQSSSTAVTSVNNITPVNGNVSLTLPQVDQTYNSSSSNAQSGSAINGLDSTLVHKTGEETITGKKIFDNNESGVIRNCPAVWNVKGNAANAAYLYLRDSGLTETTNPETFRASYIISASDTADHSHITFGTNEDGMGVIYLNARTYDTDSTVRQSSISLSIDRSGNAYTYAPSCSTANSIVTTVQKSISENGYGFGFKLGNGLIINGFSNVGINVSSKGASTITWLIPFTTYNYATTYFPTHHTGNLSSTSNWCGFVDGNKSTTSVKVWNATGNCAASILAIGY